MSEFIIKTFKGIDFTVADLDLVGFEADLNNRNLRTIAISNLVMSKRNIKVIVPQVQPAPGDDNVYELTTAEGEKYYTTIDTFNATEVNTQLNDFSREFVLIGNVLVQSGNFDLLMRKPL